MKPRQQAEQHGIGVCASVVSGPAAFASCTTANPLQVLQLQGQTNALFFPLRQYSQAFQRARSKSNLCVQLHTMQEHKYFSQPCHQVHCTTANVMQASIQEAFERSFSVNPDHHFCQTAQILVQLSQTRLCRC